MKTVFWIAIMADIMALLLLFPLGLAAAPDAKTSAFAVTIRMLAIPGLFILASILLFNSTTSPGWRGLALIVAALPGLVIFYLRAGSELEVRRYSDARGQMTYFRAGPLRDITAAISRNDAATVAALVPGIKIDTRGYSGMTLLMFALRQMRETPTS